MFNIELFIAELPLLGGVMSVALVIALILGGVGALRDGGNLRFLLVGVVMTLAIGAIGLGLLAADVYKPTHIIVDEYVDWFDFPDTFWGRAGIIAALAVPALIVCAPFCWAENRLLNWAARG